MILTVVKGIGVGLATAGIALAVSESDYVQDNAKKPEKDQETLPKAAPYLAGAVASALLSAFLFRQS